MTRSRSTSPFVRLARLAAALLFALTAFSAAGALAAPERACQRCKRPAEEGWRYCPYDGVPLPITATADAAAGAPPAEAAAGGVGRDALEAARSNPLDTVDDLFRAIAAADEVWIKRLYRWDTFFGTAPEEKIDERVSDYVKRLIAKVKPTLKGRDRIPVDIKLTPELSEIKVALRDASSKDVAITYSFKLAKTADGWKITSIRP